MYERNFLEFAGMEILMDRMFLENLWMQNVSKTYEERFYQYNSSLSFFSIKNYATISILDFYFQSLRLNFEIFFSVFMLFLFK